MITYAKADAKHKSKQLEQIKEQNKTQREGNWPHEVEYPII